MKEETGVVWEKREERDRERREGKGRREGEREELCSLHSTVGRLPALIATEYLVAAEFPVLSLAREPPERKLHPEPAEDLRRQLMPFHLNREDDKWGIMARVQHRSYCQCNISQI